jgi:hypothetical protein
VVLQNQACFGTYKLLITHDLACLNKGFQYLNVVLLVEKNY